MFMLYVAPDSESMFMAEVTDMLDSIWIWSLRWFWFPCYFLGAEIDFGVVVDSEAALDFGSVLGLNVVLCLRGMTDLVSVVDLEVMAELGDVVDLVFILDFFSFDPRSVFTADLALVLVLAALLDLAVVLSLVVLLGLTILEDLLE